MGMFDHMSEGRRRASALPWRRFPYKASSTAVDRADRSFRLTPPRPLPCQTWHHVWHGNRVTNARHEKVRWSADGPANTHLFGATAAMPPVGEATFAKPWALQLRNSNLTRSSNMSGLLELNLVVLTNTLNQDLSDFDSPDVELVVSPVDNAAASATHSTCLHLTTPDALDRSGDSSDQIHRGISCNLHARAYLVLLEFSGPSLPDYMMVISVTGRGALALFLASHELSFKVPSGCYTMATHRVLGLMVEHASQVRKCARWNEAPLGYCGYGSLSTVSGATMLGERSIIAMLMDHIPVCPCSWYVIHPHDGVVRMLQEFMLAAGATKGRDLRLKVRRI
jgi:hypothetical protein